MAQLSTSSGDVVTVLLVALAIVPSDGERVDIAQRHRAILYPGTTELRSNPDRGFRHELDDLCLAEHGVSGALSRLDECAKNNLTLAQTYCYLDPRASLQPGDPFLEMIEKGFARMRAVGVKALLRFAYDRCPDGVRGEVRTVERDHKCTHIFPHAHIPTHAHTYTFRKER